MKFNSKEEFEAFKMEKLKEFENLRASNIEEFENFKLATKDEFDGVVNDKSLQTIEEALPSLPAPWELADAFGEKVLTKTIDSIAAFIDLFS